MYTFDDPQDALDFYETDETQWILSDGVEYAVCSEAYALTLLHRTRWEMTSPERLARLIAQA